MKKKKGERKIMKKRQEEAWHKVHYAASGSAVGREGRKGGEKRRGR